MPHIRRLIPLAMVAAIGLTTAGTAATPSGAGDPTITAATLDPAARTMAAVERQIADLHARLLISSTQSARWNRFANLMRDNAHEIDGIFQRRSDAMPTMSAMENMRSYADLSGRHAAEMRRLTLAFQSLYGVMDADQKRVADQVFRDDAALREPDKGG